LFPRFYPNSVSKETGGASGAWLNIQSLYLLGSLDEEAQRPKIDLSGYALYLSLSWRYGS